VNEQDRKGLNGVLSSSVFFAFASVYLGVLNIGASATFWHGLTAAIILLPIFLYQRRTFSFSDFMSMAPLGLLRVFSFSCLYIAFQHGTVSVSNLIFLSAFLVTNGVLAPLVGEKFHKPIFGLLLVSLVGLVFVSRGAPHNFGAHLRIGEFFALLSMMTFAINMVVLRKAVQKVEPTISVLYMFVWLAVGSFPFLVIFDLTHAIDMHYWLTGKEFFYLAIVSTTGAAGHTIFARIQKYITLRMAGISLPIVAAMATLLAIPAAGDRLNSWQWFGVALVIGSMTAAAFVETAETSSSRGAPIEEPAME
jgi:drug/metabolite transporter (DMT)-like permease